MEVLIAAIGLVIVLTLFGVAVVVGPWRATPPIVGTGELEPEDWADYGEGRV